MVTGTHPEDVELFDYVEGELAGGRRAEVEVHLASCARCAERIASVDAGRAALRAAQALEFPAARRQAVLRALPAQPRARGGIPWLSPRRALVVLVPVAAVAAAVVAIVTAGGGGGNEEGAAVAGQTVVHGAPESAGALDKQAARLRVGGPARDVADSLRERGFEARVVGTHVEVRNATRAEVKRVLAGRRTTALAKQVVVVILR
jgi:anti-sigma factor RsiW